MDQAITRAAGATPRAVGEFQGFIDGEPSVVWADRKNMPQVGDKLFALPRQAAVPRTWAILLTSANHGTVGPVGSTFSHAGEHHERVQVMEIVEAGAPPAPGTDLTGMVRINAAELIGSLDEVYAWARELPIPTRGTVTAMHKVRMVKEALAAPPAAAQAVQVAATEELTRFCPACGSVGDVGPDYRDCCPDGSEARRIPKSLAEKCHELFKAALATMLAAAPAAPVQAKPLPAAQAYLAAELDPAEPVYKVADLKSAQASTAGGRQEGGES